MQERPLPPALAILRVSPRPRDRDVWSEPIQRESVTALAELHGYEIIEWAVAHMTSGADPEREPRRRMFELAEGGQLKNGAVLVHTLSRFSREPELLAVGDVAQLSRLGVVLYSALDPELDPKSPNYTLLLAVKAAGNAAERKTLIENTKRGIRKAQASGVWVGRVPFGLRKRGLVRQGAARSAEGSGLEPDPETFPALRQIFELRAQRWSLRKIGRLVGHHETAIMDILANDVYVPFIGEELWEMAQEAKKDVRGFPPPDRGEPRTYRYRGLLRCPHCARMLNGRMVKHSRRPGYRTEYYVCKAVHDGAEHPWRMISGKQIDDVVLTLLEQADIVAPLAEDIMARLKPATPDVIELAEKRRVELDAERKRVLSQHRRGYIDDVELDEAIARIKAEAAALPDARERAPEIRPTAELLASLAELWETIDVNDNDEVKAANALLRRVMTLHVAVDRSITATLTPGVAAIVAAAQAVLDEAPTNTVPIRDAANRHARRSRKNN